MADFVPGPVEASAVQTGAFLHLTIHHRLAAALPAPRWERGFSVVALLLAARGGASLINGMLNVSGTGDELSGNPVTQAIWSGIYIVSLVLLARRGRVVWRYAAQAPFVWLLLLLALVSASWSVVPSVSVRRAVALVGTSIFGLYLAVRFSKAELVRLLSWSAALGAVLSFVVIIAAPDYGITGGAWQGAFPDKNALGRFMAFGFVLWVTECIDRSSRRLVAAALAAACGVLVVFSNSRTALVVAAALLLLLPCIRALRLHYTLAVPAVLLGIGLVGGLAATALAHADALLGALGRDAALTGRGPLWSLLLEDIAARPWLGYGYGGFWLGWNGPSRHIWAATWLGGNGWLPPTGHNGLIDLALGLGVIGLALFLLTFLISFKRAIALARHTARGASVPLVTLVFVLLANTTESDLVLHNSVFWVLFVALAVRLSIVEHPIPVARIAAVPGPSASSLLVLR